MLYDVSINSIVYGSLSEHWIEESEHFVMVYSIDSYSSLDSLKDPIQYIARAHKIDKDPVDITIIGNNCHLMTSTGITNNDTHDSDNKFVTREDSLNFVNEIPRMMCE